MYAIASMDDSFYLILPSDGCPVIHPTNTPNHFRITLERDIPAEDDEKGSYEVALVEMSYMNAIKLIAIHESFMLVRRSEALVPHSAYGDKRLDPYPGTMDTLDSTLFEWAGKSPGRGHFYMGYNSQEGRIYFNSYEPDQTTRFQMPIYYLIQMGFLDPALYTRYHDQTKMHDVSPTNEFYKPFLAPFPPQKEINFKDAPTHLWARVMEETVEQLTIEPTPGYYASVNAFIEHLEKKVHSTIKSSRNKEMKKDEKKYIITFFHYSTISGHVFINLPRGYTIHFLNGFEKMLGFSKNFYLKQYVESEQLPNLYGDLYSFYVYCNLIEEKRVGHEKGKLLRNVPLVPLKSGEVVTATFERLQYSPLSTTSISTIEIEIKSDGGHPVRFEEGKTTLLLHFRRRRRR